MNTKSLTYVMRGQDYKMTYSSKMKQVNVYEKQNKQTNNRGYPCFKAEHNNKLIDDNLKFSWSVRHRNKQITRKSCVDRIWQTFVQCPEFFFVE